MCLCACGMPSIPLKSYPHATHHLPRLHSAAWTIGGATNRADRWALRTRPRRLRSWPQRCVPDQTGSGRDPSLFARALFGFSYVVDAYSHADSLLIEVRNSPAAQAHTACMQGTHAHTHTHSLHTHIRSHDAAQTNTQSEQRLTARRAARAAARQAKEDEQANQSDAAGRMSSDAAAVRAWHPSPTPSGHLPPTNLQHCVQSFRCRCSSLDSWHTHQTHTRIASSSVS